MKAADILNIDYHIFRQINRIGHNKSLDNLAVLWHVGTLTGVFYFLIAFVLYLLSANLGFVPLIQSFFSILLSTLLTEFIIKLVVKRRRPHHALHFVKVIGKTPNSYSFPSGQTGAALAIVMPFLAVSQSLPAYILMAITVFYTGYNRINMGHHFPSDVLVGGIIGAFSGLMVVCFGNMFFQ